MIKFLPHGKRNAIKAASYLVDHYDHAQRERQGVKILRGDPEIFATICDSIDNEWKYTSGVIAFSPEDNPTDKQITELLEEFEAHAFAGLEPNQYHMFAVLHEEANAKHIHILTPRIELESGKALNIAPPNHQNYFDPLRDYFNYKYDWARPDDLLRQKDYKLPHHLEKIPNLKKDQIHTILSEYIKNYIELDVIQNHDDVIQFLQEVPGVTSVRPSKHAKTEYISVKFEDRAQAIRLKGALYERDFTAETYRQIRERQTILAQQRAGNGYDPSENTAKASTAYQRSRMLRQQRQQHHQEIYASQRQTNGYSNRNGRSPLTDPRTKNGAIRESQHIEGLHLGDQPNPRVHQTNDSELHSRTNGYAVYARKIQKRKTASLLHHWVYCGNDHPVVNYQPQDVDDIDPINHLNRSDYRAKRDIYSDHQVLHGLENEYLRKLTKRAEPNDLSTRSLDPRIQEIHRCIDRTKCTVASSQQQTHRAFEQATITAFARKNIGVIQTASRDAITRYELDRPIGESSDSIENRLCRKTDYIVKANQRLTTFRTTLENTLTSNAGFSRQSKQLEQHCRETREVVQGIEDKTLCLRPRPHNANIPLDCYDTLPCLHSNFENSVDDQYLNQLIDGFKIENLITYVEHAENYMKSLKEDVVFCLERDWAKYGREDDFKRRLNTDIQQKEMLHLTHFLEHLDFIQDTKKYAELDPYSLQKMNNEIKEIHPEWKADELSPFFNERIPKLRKNLKDTIDLKREFSPRIFKSQNVVKTRVKQKNLKQQFHNTPAQLNNDFNM